MLSNVNLNPGEKELPGNCYGSLVTKDGTLGALATASVVWAGCPGSAVKLVKMPQMLSPLIQTFAHILLRTELSPQRGGQAEHLSAFFKSSASQLKQQNCIIFMF